MRETDKNKKIKSLKTFKYRWASTYNGGYFPIKSTAGKKIGLKCI